MTEPARSDNQSSYTEPSPQCPVGEQQCKFIDELMDLREEVNQLSEQVRTDTLTGLYNYHHLNLVLQQEMERTRRTSQPTSLIMVDLDHFKKVNDTWGHEVGNQALIAAAKVLERTTRQLDVVCRYGGEEFAVILPSTEIVTASQVAERIRQAIEDEPVLVHGQDIGITASLGVDTFFSQLDETQEQFIQRADEHLYQAKQQGRNCVCHGATVHHQPSAVSKEERDVLLDIFGSDESDEEE